MEPRRSTSIVPGAAAPAVAVGGDVVGRLAPDDPEVPEKSRLEGTPEGGEGIGVARDADRVRMIEAAFVTLLDAERHGDIAGR